MPFSVAIVAVVNTSLHDNTARVQDRLVYKNIGLISLRLAECIVWGNPCTARAHRSLLLD